MPRMMFDPEKAVADGENPKGFVSQTANETVRAGNSEVNSDYPYGLQADGPRWNAPIPEPMTSIPMVDAPAKNRKPGRR